MQDNTEEQMSLFDMGGLTDDGAMRDPVSGNDVPPGSMASEVRDDVPAMLSEGEYIVPADVVRYYGVKFFEDLRSQAKSGLMDMERNGRIGGEPVPGPGPSMEESELTPEEVAMLAEITGMAQGGMVMDDPRMTQYNMASHAASIPNQPMRGFSNGGLQPGVANMTQEDFMNQAQQGANFQLPRSVFTPPVPTTAAAPTFNPIMLYGPDGIAILATSQEQYNDLIGQGYTTEPQVTPTTAPAESGGDEGGIETPEVTAGEGFSLSDEDKESLVNDPLGFGTDALGVEMPFGIDTGNMARLGVALGGPGGALAGGLVGGAIEVNNLGKARAGLEIARAQGLEGTPEFTALENAVKTAEENLSGPGRLLSGLGFGSGRNFIESVSGMTPTATTGARATTGSRGTEERFTTVTPAESRTELAPATSPAPRGRPDRSDRGTPSTTTGDSAADVAADDAARASADSRAEAQKAADELGVSMATRGRATGGLVARRKKPVAKKK